MSSRRFFNLQVTLKTPLIFPKPLVRYASSNVISKDIDERQQIRLTQVRIRVVRTQESKKKVVKVFMTRPFFIFYVVKMINA